MTDWRAWRINVTECMTTRLSKLKILEISPVDRPANGVRILVRKRDGGAQPAEIKKQADTLRALAGDRLELMRGHLEVIEGFETNSAEAVQESFWALSDLMWSAREDIIALAAAVGVSEEVTAGVAKRAAIAKRSYIAKQEASVADDAVEKVDFSEEQTAALAAFDAGEATEEQTATVKAILSAAAANGGLYPKPEAVEQQEDDDEIIILDPEDEEEVEMAEETEVQKAVKAALAKQAEADKVALKKRDDEIAALQKRAQAAEDRDATREHIQKAADWGNIVNADEFGPVLKRCHDKLDDADYAYITKILDQCEAVMKESALFTEIGKKKTDGDGDGDPAAKIETIAKSLVAAGTAANIFKARVMAQNQNPKLVNEIHNREV